MSRINRLPKGFQDFLGNTNMGDNPSFLMQEVRPVVDMADFYQSDELKILSDSEIAVTGPGVVTAFTVPQGRLFFLKSVGFLYRRTGGAATDDISLSWQLDNFPLGTGAGTVPVGLYGWRNLNVENTGGSAGVLQYWFPRPIPVPGDTAIQLIASQYQGAATFNIRPNAFYLDLKA